MRFHFGIHYPVGEFWRSQSLSPFRLGYTASDFLDPWWKRCCHFEEINGVLMLKTTNGSWFRRPSWSFHRRALSIHSGYKGCGLRDSWKYQIPATVTIPSADTFGDRTCQGRGTLLQGVLLVEACLALGTLNTQVFPRWFWNKFASSRASCRTVRSTSIEVDLTVRQDARRLRSMLPDDRALPSLPVVRCDLAVIRTMQPWPGGPNDEECQATAMAWRFSSLDVYSGYRLPLPQFAIKSNGPPPNHPCVTNNVLRAVSKEHRRFLIIYHPILQDQHLSKKFRMLFWSSPVISSCRCGSNETWARPVLADLETRHALAVDKKGRS